MALDRNRLASSLRSVPSDAADLIADETDALAASGTAILTTLASTLNGEGASIVGIEDVGARYTGTDVEAALSEAATSAELASVANGEGASLVGIEDVGTLYTATDVEGALAEVKALADAAPAMQGVDATLVAGTVTIATGIVVAANSEVIPTLIGPLTGTTNFASLEELKASRVPGGDPGGTVVIEALGNDGALDVDAAGAIRVVIFTPQV